MDKFVTFAFTVRPRDGVTDDHIQSFVKYIKSKCTYYYIITEKKDDERHIHAATVFKKPVTRSNVCTCIVRIFSDLSPEERKVLQQGVRVMYNSDFMNKYMEKDDDTVVIERNLPESGCIESFFPPPLKKKTTTLSNHAMIKNLERLWHEYMLPHVEINTPNVRDFLFDMQYNKRRIGLMEDKRMFQVSKWLVRWMNRTDRCKLELPPFEKEEGPGFH